MALRVEDIYDASMDDEAFAVLALRLSQEVGARSGVLHWRSPGQAREAEISYSGHFSDADMALYEELPWGTDLWAQAINQAQYRNKIWRLEQLVPDAEYETSIIYNEWVRRIGDDTFHCIGGALENDRVILDLGFHRGRDQSRFTVEDLAPLQALCRPLLQMVEIRQKLLASRQSATVLSSALDSLGNAIVKLNANGRIIYRNGAAEALFARNDGLTEHHGRLVAATLSDQAQLEQAISLAGTAKEPSGSAVAIQRVSGHIYACSLLPIFLNGFRTTLLVIRDPAFEDPSIVSRLRTIYRLSEAEASIALAIAEGATVDQIAAERETRVDTVRTQFKSLAAKMDCRRQHEVASLVRSLPLLNQRIGNGQS